MSNLNPINEDPGGEFLIPQYKVSEKLQAIKAFVFDWDGVFNDGVKQANGSSSFNEIDSMGTNLLRYAHFVRNKQVPFTAIISGEKNDTAFFFAKRECFHASYSKFKEKKSALQHFCEAHGIKPSEICFFFDDVLDLSVAAIVGLRVFVPRKATVNLTQYVRQNHLADYITAAPSGGYAVREASEMLIAANGLYNQVITSRMNYDDSYTQYIGARNNTATQFFTWSNDQVSQMEL